MRKSGNKLSYIDNLYSQIKKYEDSIAISPLIPSSFKEIQENLLTKDHLENIVSLFEEPSIDINSENLFDVVIAKIKNIETFQAANSVKIKINTEKKGEIYEQNPALVDLVHKYTESLDVEEIKNAIRSNKIFL